MTFADGLKITAAVTIIKTTQTVENVFTVPAGSIARFQVRQWKATTGATTLYLNNDITEQLLASSGNVSTSGRGLFFSAATTDLVGSTDFVYLDEGETIYISMSTSGGGASKYVIYVETFNKP